MTSGICIICASHTHPIIKKGGLQYTQCPDCGLIAVDPQPSAEALEFAHSAEAGFHTAFSEKFLRSQRKAFTERIVSTEQLLGHKPDSVLDIGAANGLFLDAAQEHGWKTFGVEMNPQTGHECERRGHRMFIGSFDDYAPSETFSVIHMGDLIEHLRDPHLAVRRCTPILETNGLVIVGTPNADGLFQRMTLAIAKATGLDWPHALPATHTYQFTESNLSRLFKNEGYSQAKIVLSNAEFKQEMYDTDYFQVIYKYLKRKQGTFPSFLKNSFMFGLSGAIFAPLWLIGHVHYLITGVGAHMTVWYRKD